MHISNARLGLHTLQPLSTQPKPARTHSLTMPKKSKKSLTIDDIKLAMSTGFNKDGTAVNPFNFTEKNLARLFPYAAEPMKVARCNSKEGVYELLAKTEEEMRRNEREQAEKKFPSRGRVKEVVCTPTTALKKSRAATNKAKKSLALARRQLRQVKADQARSCLLYTSPSPRDLSTSRMPSSA